MGCQNFRSRIARSMEQAHSLPSVQKTLSLSPLRMNFHPVPDDFSRSCGLPQALPDLSLQVQKTFQMMLIGWVAKLAQGLGFDLPDTFTSYGELIADLFQGVVLHLIDTES